MRIRTLTTSTITVESGYENHDKLQYTSTIKVVTSLRRRSEIIFVLGHVESGAVVQASKE
jgi:hypothetical protein